MKRVRPDQVSLICLIIQITALIFIIFFLGKFRPLFVIDSDSYIKMPMGSLHEALSGIRTVGYPLFLKLIACFTPDYSATPILQIGFHFIAVFLFMIGLRMFGFSGWLALFTASPLLYVKIFWDYSRKISTDGFACSMSILVIAFLFMVVTNPRKMGYWIGTALSLFFTYQIRPAYSYLPLILPFLGLSLFLFCPLHREWSAEWKRLTVRLALTAIAPFFAFCLLRWAVVGDLGLVTLGGAHISGIAFQMLSDDLIPQLPPSLQEYARKIQDARKQEGLVNDHDEKHKSLTRYFGISLIVTFQE